ncbi:MAG: murein biosynthesis integral membrane protein MurJ [Bacillota bacterium]|jgi:putative peptidoglycan lipid II flippase
MEVKNTAKAAFIIIMITLVSKVMGFIREMVIAAGFGASFYTDAYVVALTIPAILFASFSRALQTTFIPIFNELLYQREKKEAFFFANSALTVVLVIMLILSGLAFLFMPQITNIIAPGFQGEVHQLTVTLARIMVSAGCIWGIVGIAGGMLNSFKIFGPPAAAGIIYNVFIIGTVLIFGSSLGIKGLALGTALGVAGQLMIQIPWLKRIGMTWRPHLRLHYAALRKMGRLMLPVLAASVVGQLNVVVDRLLASKLPEGSIAALNFANRLNGFALGVFVLAFVTVIFPALSQKAALGDDTGFQSLFLKGVRTIMFLTMPAIVIILVFRVPIIRLLFERGAFNSHDTIITATAFLYYGVGLLASGLREVINVAYFAVQDTRTPMFLGISCLMLNITLNLILIGPMAHGGLALATSLSVTAYTTITMILLYRKLKWKRSGELLVSLGKVVVAAGVMGLVMAAGNIMLDINRYQSFMQQAISLGGLMVAGGGAYLGMAYALKIDEIFMMFSLINERWQRIFRKENRF